MLRTKNILKALRDATGTFEMIHDNLLEVKKLDLSNRELNDIREIEVLMFLEDLDISNNPITDISVVIGFHKLKKLTMRGIDVSEAQISALQEANPKCEIIL